MSKLTNQMFFRSCACVVFFLITLPTHAQLSPIPSPAGPGSQAFRLVADSTDGALLIWHEPAPDQPDDETAPKRWALKVSHLADNTWSTPSTIDTRDDYFVNWADTPSITRAPSGELLATWLQKSSPGTYSYDIHAATSRDRGSSWNNLGVIHNDGVQAEHGFVSTTIEGDAIRLAWLDGRNMGTAQGHDAHETTDAGAMTIRTSLYRDGQFVDGRRLDSQTCECCTTDIAMTSDGPVVVYRDRTDSHVRDIFVTHTTPRGWSIPKVVWGDNWNIRACPVNGPAIDAIDNNVAVAWFTGARGANAVNVIFSTDAGRSFLSRHRIEFRNTLRDPIGRVDVLLDDDGSAIVTYQRRNRSGGGGQIVAQRVNKSGMIGDAVVLTQTSPGRSTGFPKISRVGDRYMLAWTSVSENNEQKRSHIQTAFAAIP